MPHIRPMVWVILLACSVMGIASGCRRPAGNVNAEPASQSATQAVAASTRDASSNMQSCATAACHGDMIEPTRSQGVTGAEFVFFQSRDPHSQASATLASDESQRMLDRLTKTSTKSRIEWLTSCRACHAPTSGEQEPHRNGQLADFNCAACHEAADDAEWVDSHFRDQHDPSKYSNETADLNARAQLCSKCHVGTPDFQVDHDLIAAGHPALKFELASYLELLPKHWSDRFEREAIADLELRLWLGGQLSAAKRSLDLLDSRLTDAKTTWPEFGELDCFQCHQDLRGSGWRGDDAAAIWGTWYFWLAEMNAGGLPDVGHPLREYADGASSLRQTLQSSWPQSQSDVAEETVRQRVSLQDSLRALASDGELGEWLSVQVPRLAYREQHLSSASGSLSKNQVSEQVNKIVTALLHAPPARDWDGAVQRYLAVAAIIQSIRDRNAIDAKVEVELQAELQTIRGILRFRDGLDSPTWSKAGEGGAQRTKFNEALSRLSRRVLELRP